jgi:gluconokinase
MYQRTGAPLHVSYALPQLRAFYANEENRHLANRIERWQTLSTICVHRWTGRPHFQMPISFSEASWTGMLDFRSCSWDQEALSLAQTCPGVTQYDNRQYDDDPKDDIELLPPLFDFDSPLPFLKEGIPRCNNDGSNNQYWERWPEFRSPSLSMFLGIGDGAAATIGSKCGGGGGGQQDLEGQLMQQRRIAVTIGTSAAARVCLPLSHLWTPSSSFDQVRIPPGLFCYRVHRDTILLGGALTDGGCVVEWARSLLSLQSPESFDACMAQVNEKYCCKRKRSDKDDVVDDDDATSSSNDRRVTMIPFLSGERSTGYRAGAKACISNLTRETTPNDVMYACLESVTLRLRRVLLLINEACPQFSSPPTADGAKNVLIASGTALERNALWRRMLADCSNMDVIVDNISAEEATSHGVAILLANSLQRTGLGLTSLAYGSTTERPLVVTSETKCNADAKKRWAVAASSQDSLIDAIASTWNL